MAVAVSRWLGEDKNQCYRSEMISFSFSFPLFSLGATTHYFGLALSFWVTCFIANTYAVIVRHKRAVFKHPTRIHVIQSLLCWVGPAIIVAACLLVDPPGYTFLFMDLLAAGPTSTRRAYFSATLPKQVTLVLSLCLLWAIVWHLRKVTGFLCQFNWN